MKFFKYAITRPSIKVLENHPRKAHGSYWIDTKEITLAKSAPVGTKAHELTHWMQDRKNQYAGLNSTNPIKTTKTLTKLETAAYYKQKQRQLAKKGIPVTSIKSKVISRASGAAKGAWAGFFTGPTWALRKAIARR